MIVPRNRLLYWTMVLVLPFAAMGGIVPSSLPLCTALTALFVAVAVLDAVLAWRLLDRFGVEYPGVCRMTKDRPGSLAVRILNPDGTPGHVRMGIPFPPEIQSEEETMEVALPAGEAARVDWPCRASRRGLHVLEACYLEKESPLGFWSRRRAFGCRGEIRVYPNLSAERRYLAGLFLNRGGAGTHAQRQVGKGRDFEKLREYIPGDSFDEIHWKATAKRGRPVTKVYQIERTQEIYVLIDSSRLSARTFPFARDPRATAQSAVQEVPILERFIATALILCQATERQGDLFGLLTFNDQVRRFVPARNGKEHYGLCRDALYTLEPRAVTPDFGELFTFIRTRMTRRALLMILTSLDDPTLAESFAEKVSLIARHHLVLVNMPCPLGVRPLFSHADGGREGDLYANLAGHLRWRGLHEWTKVLHNRGVQFSLIGHDAMSTEIVSQYLRVKQRQAL
jgi:uncharacterized protein (DUF58 family)